MRHKYRSAIYTFSNDQKERIKPILEVLNTTHSGELITQVLDYGDFKTSRDEILNYYYTDPKKPFCETFIDPKLRMLLDNYADAVDHTKLNHLKENTLL